MNAKFQGQLADAGIPTRHEERSIIPTLGQGGTDGSYHDKHRWVHYDLSVSNPICDSHVKKAAGTQHSAAMETEAPKRKKWGAAASGRFDFKPFHAVQAGRLRNLWRLVS